MFSSTFNTPFDTSFDLFGGSMVNDPFFAEQPGFGSMGMGGMGGLGSRRFQPRRQQMRTTRGMMAPGFGFGAAAGAPALGYTPGFGGEMMAPRQVSMQGVASDWYPDMDAIETDDALEILIEIPGIPRDAIKLNVQDGYLVIDGQKETDPELEKSRNVRLTERDFGRFRRTLRLPTYVKTDDIEAKTENGVLTVRLLKTEQGRRSKIQIE